MLGTKSCGGDKTESKTGLPGSSIFWGMETGWQVMKHCKVWGSIVDSGHQGETPEYQGEIRREEQELSRGRAQEGSKQREAKESVTRRTKRPAGWGGEQRTAREKASKQSAPYHPGSCYQVRSWDFIPQAMSNPEGCENCLTNQFPQLKFD